MDDEVVSIEFMFWIILIILLVVVLLFNLYYGYIGILRPQISNTKTINSLCCGTNFLQSLFSCLLLTLFFRGKIIAGLHNGTHPDGGTLVHPEGADSGFIAIVTIVIATLVVLVVTAVSLLFYYYELIETN